MHSMEVGRCDTPFECFAQEGGLLNTSGLFYTLVLQTEDQTPQDVDLKSHRMASGIARLRFQSDVRVPACGRSAAFGGPVRAMHAFRSRGFTRTRSLELSLPIESKFDQNSRRIDFKNCSLNRERAGRTGPSPGTSNCAR